jgi:hypothetical protein
MPAPDYITPLGNTASFYDWFNSYNTDALGKLNKMYAYEIYGGNGIGITHNSGGYTVFVSDTIANGITFNGPVAFTNTVTLPSSQTSLSNVSVVFSGDYSSSGVTLGRVVRVTTAGGLSLAYADGPTLAEALGIVTTFSTSSATVALLGKISGSTLASQLIEGAGAFSTGCVYFLSDTTQGKVKTTEPTTTGKVSKPILIATGHDNAIILPYRGQYLNGVCGASGESLVDSLVVPIVSQGETEENYELKPGALLAVSSTEISTSTNYSSSPSPSGYYYKANSSTPVSSILGIISNYASGTTYNSTSGGLNYMIVRPAGSVVSYTDLGWTGTYKNTGLIYLDSSGEPSKTVTSQGSIGIATNDYFTFLPTPSTSVYTTSALVTGSTSKSKNVLINGSLHVWQRRDYGDFPGVTGYTSASDFYAKSSATGGYFADRWCLLNSNPTGQTFTISKNSFSDSQLDVAGYPKNYFNLTATRSGVTHYFEFENRVQDARNNSGREMILSFYAKNDTGTGVTFTPYVKQYGSSLTTNTFTDIFISGASWQRYSRIINVPLVGGTAFGTESYFSVGLRSKSSTVNVNFAQFMFEEGVTFTTPELTDVNDEYRKCSYYYQRSYPVYTRTGANTLNRTETGLTATTSNYFHNDSNVYLGGAERIVIMNYNDIDHTVRLPVRMRSSSYFTVDSGSETYPYTGSERTAKMTKPVPIKLFSPTTGVGSYFAVEGGGTENNLYNLTAKANLTKCNGTNAGVYYTDLARRLGIETDVPKNIRQYVVRAGNAYQAVASAGTDGSVESIGVRILQGFVPMDIIAFHYVVDLDLYHGLT